MIRAAVFKTYLNKPDTKIFTVSLYKLNQAIDERKKESSRFVPRQDNESEEQFLQRTVLREYYNLIDVFSKSESDKLSPYWSYNYKIELIGKNNLGYLLLRQYTLEELTTIKKYITENLQKGFI